MIYKIKNFSIFLFVILLVVKLNGCFYSFTGASVPSHLKTIAIPVFEDKSGSGEPGLRENFTNELIQKFTDDNTLQVAPRTNADAVLDCSITSLSEAFNSITTESNNQEAGSSKRLTISVRVIYKDLVLKKTISDKKYSEYGDYDLTGNIVLNRQTAITTAMDRITDDILLGTVSNW
jgi:hypothetical protein